MARKIKRSISFIVALTVFLTARPLSDLGDRKAFPSGGRWQPQADG